MPEISVLMGVLCTNDKLPLLREAVDSIRRQSFGDFELLVCDDGSAPEVSGYLDSAALEDHRIRLIRPGGRISLPQKLNSCLESASGRLIARMDDDDLSYPERFEIQKRFLDEHQKIDFVGCNVELYDNGAVVGIREFPQTPSVEDFYFSQPFIHPALMFRRGALELAGGYSEEKRCVLCEDYDLLLRMYSAGLHGANIRQSLLRYTLSPTAKGRKKYRYRINEARTRYVRFRELHRLPGALPYVIKPLIVGLLPNKLVCKLRNRKDNIS